MGNSSAGDGGSVSRFLLDHGPTMLVVSIVLVTLALALRRWVAAAGAALVGAIMYWGMYVQTDVNIDCPVGRVVRELVLSNGDPLIIGRREQDRTQTITPRSTRASRPRS